MTFEIKQLDSKIIIYHDDNAVVALTDWYNDHNIVLHRWSYQRNAIRKIPLRELDYPVDHYYYACKLIGVDLI